MLFRSTYEYVKVDYIDGNPCTVLFIYHLVIRRHIFEYIICYLVTVYDKLVASKAGQVTRGCGGKSAGPPMSTKRRSAPHRLWGLPLPQRLHPGGTFSFNILPCNNIVIYSVFIKVYIYNKYVYIFYWD